MSTLKERNFDGYLLEPRGTNSERPPRSKFDFLTEGEKRDIDAQWRKDCIANLGVRGEYFCDNCGAYHREKHD